MVKKALIIACLAVTLLSCSLLNTINGKDEPLVIVVTATPEQALPTETQAVEPTAIRESITITDPVSATLTELAGPFTDTLIRNDNAHVASYCADVNVQDFKATVTFTSLPGLNSNTNSFAFFFRQTGDNDQYRLIISKSAWELYNVRDLDHVLINNGTLMMTWGERNPNKLVLYSVGDSGYFYMNGYYIFKLNLKDRPFAGDVCVVSSVYTGNTYGTVTEFNDFQVWELTQP